MSLRQSKRFLSHYEMELALQSQPTELIPGVFVSFRALIIASFLFTLPLGANAAAPSCQDIFAAAPRVHATIDSNSLLLPQAMDVLARIKIDIALIEVHARSGFKNLEQNQVWQLRQRFKQFHDYNLYVEGSPLPYPFAVKFSGVHAKYSQTVLHLRFFEKATQLGFSLKPPVDLQVKKTIPSQTYWTDLIESLSSLNNLAMKLDRMQTLGAEGRFVGHGIWLNRHELQQLPRLLSESLTSVNQLARRALESHDPQTYNFESIRALFTRHQELLDNPALRSYRRAFTWTVIGSDRRAIGEARRQMIEFRRLQSLLPTALEDSQ